MRIGRHMSISGSLEKAAIQGAEIGANTIQIFSASPRMWRATMPAESEIKLFQRARQRHDITPLVIHDSYLINLAAANAEVLQKSIVAFRGELERAIAIGADYLVAHPGNHKGYTLEQGLATFVGSLAEAAAGLPSDQVTILIENTAGAGSSLGGRFEELAVLREYAIRQTDIRIGFCIDTCHCLASGYNVATPEGLEETVATAARLLGLDNIQVIHANDSEGGLSSHIDRHANIGHGNIGEDGFRGILNHPGLREKAFILETPVDNEGDDRREIENIKGLCRTSRTIIRKSK